MPEMIKYCGQRVRVDKRAHKTCDSIEHTGLRKMTNAVHLEELRCDGSAHGGCQAECNLFWKESWLKRIDAKKNCQAESLESISAPQDGHRVDRRPICTYEALYKESKVDANALSGQESIYSCQATELPKATTAIGKNEIRHYWEDVRSGNVTIRELIGTSIFWAWLKLFWFSAIHLEMLPLHIRCWNAVQRVRKGIPYPFSQGLLTGKTPAESLGLKPGELVEVKSLDEILGTLNTNNRNRGLSWNQELVPFTRQQRRVRSRVERIIDEKTGRMIRLPNECIVLENVYCRAWYRQGYQFCPRKNLPYWREIWLRRVAK
jgi:hypothetical protein